MKKIKFVFNKMMWHISALGTSIFLILLVIASFLAGQEALSLKLLAGLVFVLVTVFPLKWAFHKERPDKQGHRNWIERLDASTFPSAHSARSAAAFVILSAFFSKLSLSIFILAISLLISYSRVYLERHYWKDIVVGYLMGLAEGVLIVIFL